MHARTHKHTTARTHEHACKRARARACSLTRTHTSMRRHAQACTLKARTHKHTHSHEHSLISKHAHGMRVSAVDVRYACMHKHTFSPPLRGSASPLLPLASVGALSEAVSDIRYGQSITPRSCSSFTASALSQLYSFLLLVLLLLQYAPSYQLISVRDHSPGPLNPSSDLGG